MDPHKVACFNEACLASGQVGKVKLCIHRHEERRTVCAVYGGTLAAAFAGDERMVDELRQISGSCAEAVHLHLVEQRRDLGQVQADEIRVRVQGVILYWGQSSAPAATVRW